GVVTGVTPGMGSPKAVTFRNETRVTTPPCPDCSGTIPTPSATPVTPTAVPATPTATPATATVPPATPTKATGTDDNSALLTQIAGRPPGQTPIAPATGGFRSSREGGVSLFVVGVG